MDDQLQQSVLFRLEIVAILRFLLHFYSVFTPFFTPFSDLTSKSECCGTPFLSNNRYSWADEILLDSLLESSNSRRDFDENY